MPAYKYTTKDGKFLWYCSFHYTDWTGEYKRKCKRGFKTKREALEWERDFLSKGAKDPEIRFRALAEAYMQDQESRLKPTTLHNKQHLINSRIMPYFENMKIKDIDAIKIRRWQNELVNYKDKNGKPFAQTYLRTINTQLSAIMNYAVRYYDLPKNPCRDAGSIGKSRAGEMKIWTREQFEHFIQFEKKPSYRVAFNILFYSGIREGDADGKISLNQQKPSKHAGLRRFGPEKFLQRNNEFMKERPIFYKKPIKTEKDFSTWLRCFYYTTKAVITEYIYF